MPNAIRSSNTSGKASRYSVKWNNESTTPSPSSCSNSVIQGRTSGLKPRRGVWTGRAAGRRRQPAGAARWQATDLRHRHRHRQPVALRETRAPKSGGMRRVPAVAARNSRSATGPDRRRRPAPCRGRPRPEIFTENER